MNTQSPIQDFDDALKKLGIEDFRSQIWHSNSRGEMFHLGDYVVLASMPCWNAENFRPLFLYIVDWTKEHWKRPESCYQHMPTLIKYVLAQLSS